MVMLVKSSKTLTAVGIVFFSIFQVGCATSSEGSAGGILGGVLGGTIGAAECLIKGTSVKNCKNEIIVGAAVGAAVGFMAGTRLEERRLEGQSDLEFVQANNADMAKRNIALRKKNSETRQLIVEAEKEAKVIKASVASSSAKQAKFKSVVTKLKKDEQAVKVAKKEAKSELGAQQEMLAAVKKGDFPVADEKKLEKEIASLRSQISVLEKGELELASISSTTF